MTSTRTDTPVEAAPRPPRRSAVRSPRGRRATAATTTAVLSVAVFAVGAVEAISLAMHRRTVGIDVGRVARFGRDTHLGDRIVLLVAVIAAVLGVLLLLVAAVPPPRALVELVEPDDAVAAGLTRRSLHRTLAAAALAVDGVSSAKVTGRRRLTVRAATSFRNTDALPDRVRERVTARLADLDPVRPRTVRARLTRKDA